MHEDASGFSAAAVACSCAMNHHSCLKCTSKIEEISKILPMPGSSSSSGGGARGDLPEGLSEEMQQEFGHEWCSHNFQDESTWGPLQLEVEMAAGFWICVRPNGFYLTSLWCQAMPAIMR